jgi:hypothetical protein
MDWIEQLLHVSPDGGGGATELVYLAVAVFAVGRSSGGTFRTRSQRTSSSMSLSGCFALAPEVGGSGKPRSAEGIR